MNARDTKEPPGNQADWFERLIEDLFGLFFLGRKAQWTIYATTLVLATAYATVGTVVLKRPEREVLWEAIILCCLLSLSLPLTYALRAGQSRRKAPRVDDEELAVSSPEISSARLSRDG